MKPFRPLLILLLLAGSACAQTAIRADVLTQRFADSRQLPSRTDYLVSGEIRSGLPSGGSLYGPPSGLGIPRGKLEGYGSRIPRLARLDGSNPRPGDSILRLQNDSASVRYVALYGRHLPTDILSGAGTPTPYGIIIEGRGDRGGTGKHTIEDVVISDCGKAAIAFLGGYIASNGQWIVDKNHGDTCTVRAHVANSPIGLFIDNPQAIGSHFELHTLNVASGVEFHAGVQTAGEGYLYIGTPKATALRIVVTRKLHTWSPAACTTNWHIHRDPFPDSVEQAYTAVEIEPGKLCDKCDGVSREVETVCRHCGHDKFHSDLGSDDKEFSKFRINLRLTGAFPPNSTPEDLVRLNGFNPEFIVVK